MKNRKQTGTRTPVLPAIIRVHNEDERPAALAAHAPASPPDNLPVSFAGDESDDFADWFADDPAPAESRHGLRLVPAPPPIRDIRLNVEATGEEGIRQQADLETWVRALLDDQPESILETSAHVTAPRAQKTLAGKSGRKKQTAAAPGNTTPTPAPAVETMNGMPIRHATDSSNALPDTTGAEREQADFYARFFHGARAFDTPDAARQSVAHIDRMFHYFERVGDRDGQHHAMVAALTGRNHARWHDRPEAAALFAEWLAAH
ncbi:MAG: hypothetical protein ACKV2V_04940 [Blastocatellia bacterium]